MGGGTGGLGGPRTPQAERDREVGESRPVLTSPCPPRWGKEGPEGATPLRRAAPWAWPTLEAGPRTWAFLEGRGRAARQVPRGLCAWASVPAAGVWRGRRARKQSSAESRARGEDRQFWGKRRSASLQSRARRGQDTGGWEESFWLLYGGRIVEISVFSKRACVLRVRDALSGRQRAALSLHLLTGAGEALGRR